MELENQVKNNKSPKWIWASNLVVTLLNLIIVILYMALITSNDVKPNSLALASYNNMLFISTIFLIICLIIINLIGLILKFTKQYSNNVLVPFVMSIVLLVIFLISGVIGIGFIPIYFIIFIYTFYLGYMVLKKND